MYHYLWINWDVCIFLSVLFWVQVFRGKMQKVCDREAVVMIVGIQIIGGILSFLSLKYQCIEIYFNGDIFNKVFGPMMDKLNTPEGAMVALFLYLLAPLAAVVIGPLILFLVAIPILLIFFFLVMPLMIAYYLLLSLVPLKNTEEQRKEK